MSQSICYCGAQPSYPHADDCPYPFYGRDAAGESRWLEERSKKRQSTAVRAQPAPQEMTSDSIHGECVDLAIRIGRACWSTGIYDPPETAEFKALQSRFKELDREFHRRFHAKTLDKH
jgi:hypothetical protein